MSIKGIDKFQKKLSKKRTFTKNGRHEWYDLYLSIYKYIYIDRERVQDLCLVHYQILLIILQKKFLKLSIKIVVVSLNMKVSRTI